MYSEKFVKRLIQLRIKKNVSARDMSLSIGQNSSYINSIENGKSLPSMAIFFNICEFLEITPQEFFNFDDAHPAETSKLSTQICKLDDEYLKSIEILVSAIIDKS